MTAALFVIAAGSGALLRWRVGLSLPRPLGTVVVNVLGAFALGAADAWTAPELTIIGVGGLGAFTTFSTLSDDLVGLLARRPVLGAAYVAVTISAGIGAAAVGMALGG